MPAAPWLLLKGSYCGFPIQGEMPAVSTLGNNARHRHGVRAARASIAIMERLGKGRRSRRLLSALG
jgi:hypothetical protein